MSIVALVFAAAAVYFSVATVTNGRATAHFARAASLYAARLRDAGDAEMERGRKLARRADKMLGALAPLGGNGRRR